MHSRRNNYNAGNNNVSWRYSPLELERARIERCSTCPGLVCKWGAEKCIKQSFNSSLKCVSSYHVVHWKGINTFLTLSTGFFFFVFTGVWAPVCARRVLRRSMANLCLSEEKPFSFLLGLPVSSHPPPTPLAFSLLCSSRSHSFCAGEVGLPAVRAPCCRGIDPGQVKEGQGEGDFTVVCPPRWPLQNKKPSINSQSVISVGSSLT